ncbi:MAG: hypothetical protein GEU71_09710, partial [Actinobacteria bacterium]|nr:hypothetical protein [Actinomycetota bacterium]
SPRLIDAAGVGSPGLFYGGGFSQLGVQALGVAAVAAWALGASAIVFGAIKATVGLRVSAEEEIEGLDIGEHGMWGYPETFLGTDVAPSPDIVEKARREAKERAVVAAEPALAVEPT